jgi:hypothetical protein
MGNHDIGRGMSAAARAFWIAMGDAEPTKKTALAALDAAAEDYRGGDAEFDDEMSTYSPLSRLVAVALGASPDEIDDLKGEHECKEDEIGMLWYEGPYQKFRKRYKFC